MRRKHRFIDYMERMDVPPDDRVQLHHDMMQVDAIRGWIEPESLTEGDQFTLHNGLFACRAHSGPG